MFLSFKYMAESKIYYSPILFDLPLLYCLLWQQPNQVECEQYKLQDQGSIHDVDSYQGLVCPISVEWQYTAFLYVGDVSVDLQLEEDLDQRCY